MTPITFTLKEAAMLGAGFFALGGLFARSLIQGKSIAVLWEKKQDIKVCETEHTHVTKELAEIKTDVKWLRNREENGGD